jgi:hypothetical protein
MKNLEKQAIGIINQLYDLAEVPVEKRQAINDEADKYLLDQVLRLSDVSQQRELLLSELVEWLVINTDLDMEKVVEFEERFKQ